jgi:hypothetical protein
LPSKGPLSIQTSCMRNEVDARKETHRLLYRARRGLHRCFADDARFGAAFRIELAGVSWFGSEQAWNLKECEE